MKKFLLTILFVIFGLGTAGSFQAQSMRDAAPVQDKDNVEVQAFPNPTKNVLVLKSKDSSLKIKSVAFYNILGTQVATYSINAGSSEINIEKLRPGKYLMKYTLSNQSQKVIQIIKQ